MPHLPEHPSDIINGNKTKKASSSLDRVEKYYPDQNLKKKINDYCEKNDISKSSFMCDLAKDFFKKQTV